MRKHLCRLPWERMCADFTCFVALTWWREIHHFRPIPHGRQRRLHEIRLWTWSPRKPGQRGRLLIWRAILNPQSKASKAARQPTRDALQKEVLARTWACFTDANFSVWWWRTLSLVGLATLTISVMSPLLDGASSKLHSFLRNKIGSLRTPFSFPELVKVEHSYPLEETVSFQSAGKETFPETDVLCPHCCVFPWTWENGKNDWLPCGHPCWIPVMVCSLENKQAKPRDE